MFITQETTLGSGHHFRYLACSYSSELEQHLQHCLETSRISRLPTVDKASKSRIHRTESNLNNPKILLLLSLFTVSCSLGSFTTVAGEEEMRKGLHPQMQWISYVTQSGRLMHVMMTKIHNVGKVYHFRARRQMAEHVGQIAKFNRRFVKNEETEEENK